MKEPDQNGICEQKEEMEDGPQDVSDRIEKVEDQVNKKSRKNMIKVKKKRLYSNFMLYFFRQFNLKICVNLQYN